MSWLVCVTALFMQQKAEPALPAGAVARFGTAGDPSAGLVALAISPDGKLLAAGGYDKAIRIWDRTSQKLLHQLTEEHWVMALAFSPDGKQLVSGRWWDVGAGKALPQWKPRPVTARAVAFSPDGKTLAIAYEDRQTHLVDVASGKVLQHLPDDLDWISALAFSPDGKTLAVGGHGVDAFRLFDVVSTEEQHRFSKHADWVHGLAFTADGKVLASASADRTLRLWDLTTRAELEPRLQGLNTCLYSVAFSPDGQLVAAGAGEQGVALWEVASGQLIRRYQGHDGEVRGVAFLPDGRALASASTDGTVLLWDITGWSEANLTPPLELSAEIMDELWSNLAKSASDAQRAKWRLIAAKGAVPFLRAKLKPVDPARLARLVADLDADEFDQREKASADLEQLGAVAEIALKQALASKPSLEMTRRIEELLKRLQSDTGNRLRVLRAVAALEQIGTPDAQRVLEELRGKKK